MKTITDHELSKMANDWVENTSIINIGIRTAFAHGYRKAEKQVKNCIIPDVRCSALFDAMGSFAVKTFPDAGSIEHLKKLKHEADEAIAEPQNVEEYADMLLALFGAAEKAGITHKQLIEASEGKLEVVKTRTWVKLPDGTYQHCT